MEFQNSKTSIRIALSFNHVIYLCVLLACLVPRYISTFKIRLGINISYYTVAVVLVWLISARRMAFDKSIEC